MGPATLAFCLALGVPAETPSYSYQARQAEISQCVDLAEDHWAKTGDAGPLGRVLDVQAACLSYCPSRWSIKYE